MFRRGTIADGLNDVANYLDLQPYQTVFIHSSVINPNDPKIGHLKRQLKNFPLRFAQILGYMPRSKTVNKNAKGVILPIATAMIDYFAKVGLVNREDLLIVGKTPQHKNYPEASVAAQLRLSNIDLLNKHLISSVVSCDEEKTNARLIITPEKQLQFESKIWFRKFASKDSYSVPIGVEIETSEQFTAKIAALKQLISAEKLPVTEIELWLKFEAQSSGLGSIKIKGLTESNIELLRTNIAKYAKQLNDSDFAPVVIELDVSSEQEMSLLENIGIQAVISQRYITIVGATLQKTKDGQYIGCEITPELQKYWTIAEQTARPALQSYYTRGYRGYLNLDILIATNKNTKQLKGYIIDPNARFSGGTPLLSLSQYASKMVGKPSYGIMYSNYIKASYSEWMKLCGDDLYLGSASNYQGIIPLLLNDIFSEKGKPLVATVAVLGTDMKIIRQQYARYKKRLTFK